MAELERKAFIFNKFFVFGVISFLICLVLWLGRQWVMPALTGLPVAPVFRLVLRLPVFQLSHPAGRIPVPVARKTLGTGRVGRAIVRDVHARVVSAGVPRLRTGRRPDGTGRAGCAAFFMGRNISGPAWNTGFSARFDRLLPAVFGAACAEFYGRQPGVVVRQLAGGAGIFATKRCLPYSATARGSFRWLRH
jgi:hypothetical protein